MQNKLFILLLVTSLISCGGSKSSTSDETEMTTKSEPVQTESQTTAAISTADEQTQAHQTEMAQMQVDSDFDLTTHFSLELIIEPNTFNSRVFINVCSLTDKEQPIDYNLCLLRTSVTTAGLRQELTIPNSDAIVMAEVWHFDASQPATQYYWQREDANDIAEFLVP